MKPYILMAVIAMLVVGCESEDDRRAIYNAWCKLNHRNDITLQEWTLLRDNYLLSGMEAKRIAEAEAASAAAIGAAIGAASASSD